MLELMKYFVNIYIHSSFFFVSEATRTYVSPITQALVDIIYLYFYFCDICLMVCNAAIKLN